jgi:hypothetical protein
MDTKELKGLMEAYQQVHTPEEIEEGVKGERNSMRRLAAQERAAERKERGGAAPKVPGRMGKSSGTSYADYQQVSIAAHDRASKKNKIIPGMAHEEVEIDEATALNREEFGLDQMVESLIERGHTEQEAYALVAQFTFSEGYQRNPEKGEKEDKKYAPVRGEKTPMPPRGDKRREDFEKWYRANVR